MWPPISVAYLYALTSPISIYTGKYTHHHHWQTNDIPHHIVVYLKLCPLLPLLHQRFVPKWWWCWIFRASNICIYIYWLRNMTRIGDFGECAYIVCIGIPCAVSYLRPLPSGSWVLVVPKARRSLFDFQTKVKCNPLLISLSKLRSSCVRWAAARRPTTYKKQQPSSNGWIRPSGKGTITILCDRSLQRSRENVFAIVCVCVRELGLHEHCGTAQRPPNLKVKFTS